MGDNSVLTQFSVHLDVIFMEDERVSIMAGKGEFQIGPGDTADCGMSTTVRKRNEGKLKYIFATNINLICHL
jgi:hypothetical protein